MRHLFLSLSLACFALLSGCGYHKLDTYSHLPQTVHTLAIPMFENRTQTFHAEVVFTQAVTHEFTSRTPLHITPAENAPSADATLHGIIQSVQIGSQTYDSRTGRSSSFLVTIDASVVLKDRDGRVLFSNPHYIFRQQYQTTSDAPSFVQEDPAAVSRLARDFAHTLVSDVLESF